jgi:heme A synthase
VAHYTLAPRLAAARKTFLGDAVSQILFLHLPMPVTLALIAMVLVLLGVARMLASLRKPVPLRRPRQEHDKERTCPY